MAYTGTNERPPRPPGARRTWRVIGIVFAVLLLAAAAAALFNQYRNQVTRSTVEADTVSAPAPVQPDPATQSVVYGDATLSPPTGSLDEGGGGGGGMTDAPVAGAPAPGGGVGAGGGAPATSTATSLSGLPSTTTAPGATSTRGGARLGPSNPGPSGGSGGASASPGGGTTGPSAGGTSPGSTSSGPGPGPG